MVERKKRKLQQDGSDPGGLNFCILRPVYSAHKYSIVLQWDNEEVLERLVARTRENLIMDGLFFNPWHSKRTVEKSVRKAWNSLIKEFSELTIQLP